MKVNVGKPVFAKMPKDYIGLCGLSLPRPIKDKIDFVNVKEITDSMAGFEDEFSEDQCDYFELLCTLLEDYETITPIDHPLPPVSGLEILKHLLQERDLSGADLSRILGGTRALGPMILRGDRSLTIKHVRTLSRLLGVSADLLLTERQPR